jgi:hypothetical protein
MPEMNGRVWRRVERWEWTGACASTGYEHKSVRLILSCGHEQVRKASRGVPIKALCGRCASPIMETHADVQTE